MGKVTLYISCLLVLLVVSLEGFGQPGTTVDLKKQEKYEKHILNSEKTGNKKFTFSKRFTQNAFSHYNYYFNANTMVNDIIEEAKRSFKDDYTALLPFNNYSLDATQGNGNIDSIIYECNAGIRGRPFLRATQRRRNCRHVVQPRCDARGRAGHRSTDSVARRCRCAQRGHEPRSLRFFTSRATAEYRMRRKPRQQ